MSGTSASMKIDRLKRLVAEKQRAEREAEKPPAPPEALPVVSESVASPFGESPDLEGRPASLQGLTCREIQLLELDSGLNDEEEAWMITKHIPTSDGLRMPRLRAILKHGTERRK